MIRCGFYERCVTPPIGAEIPGYWCRRPSTGILDARGQVEEDLPVQVSMVGDTFIVAMPGEPYHVFGCAIKRGCPTGKCIISTLSHGMFGYMPTPDLLGTYIYPGQLCVGSRFEGDTDDRVVKAALETMDELLAK